MTHENSITLLASPKSFEGSAAAIQECALRNWNSIVGDVEIILYGATAGVDKAALRHNARHVPEIATAPSGVPLFSAIAEHARSFGRSDRQIYLNADILLPANLLERIAAVPFSRYLITGERIDLMKGVQWDFNEGWEEQIARLSRAGGASAHGPTGMDYFIFPRGIWQGLKSLPIGRGGYDNALLAYCLRAGIPIIDATLIMPVIHQWHDYSQLPGGRQEVHGGSEAVQIRREHDIWRSPPQMSDADWIATPAGLRSGHCRGDRLRAYEVRLRYRRGWRRLSYGLRVLWRLRAMIESKLRLRSKSSGAAVILG